MAITPIQPNTETASKTYRDAKTPIKTNGLKHPLPAEGHLVHDTLLSVPKFWMKDIAYDMKAVKYGFIGKAKDHQTGRLNDVGLKLGGIGIATYLASRTTDPKMRVMEYLGLGAFLASMSLYPKLAINAPSRIIQGFDIGKEYIDDQGRKKSVYQDGNYIPFDMYRGEFTDEDLDIIGDNMGIPRNIKNRNELIKEQARKIAVQNNTLWMLGAGVATPVMTALICCGLEKVVTPVLEYTRNKYYNSAINKILNVTENMTLNIKNIQDNTLSENVAKLLTNYKDKELPKEEFDKLINMLSYQTDENLKEGIKEDITKLLTSEKNGYVVDEKFADNIPTIIKETVNGRHPATVAEVFNPTAIEIKEALRKAGSDGKYVNEEQLKAFKNELRNIFKSKIEAHSGNKNYLYMEQDNIIENICKSIQKSPSSFVSEKGIKDITNLAKILGEFKSNDKILDKCKSFKVEYAPETVAANYYKKFESVIFDILDIKYKDLKLMKESDKYTKEIVDKKIQSFVQDKEKYAKGIKKLAKVMSEMEIALHGKFGSDSYLKDLITAYENNYNITAKRINAIGNNKFSNTIGRLVKGDPNTLKPSLETKENLFNLIDGLKDPIVFDKNKPYDKAAMEYAEALSEGVGSSKAMKISRIIERLQGISNSQRRLIHTLDVYSREIPGDEYGKHLNKKVKEILLEATSADHSVKLRTENNPQYYLDLFRTGWEAGLQKETREALKSVSNDLDTGNILERFEKYIKRFKDVIGNNDIDFTKPDHKFVEDLKEGFRKFYHADSTTRMQKFNLIAQNPIDFFKKASRTRFENQKWLRTASAIGGSVIAATVLIQFCFGKIKNPQNIQKQVNDDKNS